MISFFWLVVTQIFFGMFTPKLGEDEPILRSIFFRWVETTNQIMMRFVTDTGERTPWSIEIAACCWRGRLKGWILGKLGHIHRFFSKDYHHHSLLFLQPDILPNLGCWRIAAFLEMFDSRRVALSSSIMEVERCFVVIVESKTTTEKRIFFDWTMIMNGKVLANWGVVFLGGVAGGWKHMKTLLGIILMHDQKCLLKIASLSAVPEVNSLHGEKVRIWLLLELFLKPQGFRLKFSERNDFYFWTD